MHPKPFLKSPLTICTILVVGSAALAELPPRMNGKDGSTMLLVPTGPFVMGSGEAKDETPPHRVSLPAFYIDQTEVTVAQYAAFIKATGNKTPTDWVNGQPPAGREQMPITNITWFDAMKYAIWAGKRLPTEAEWEKAARGTDGRRFPWGNVDDESLRNLGSDKISSTYHKTIATAEKPKGASPYGCLDMSGNAWEWTADWYDGYPGTSARSPHFGKQYKVMRGGGGIYFYGVANSGTCTQRARLVPYGAHDSLGFRCVSDTDLAKRPYDPQTVLAEAEKRFTNALGEPAKLSYELEFDKMNLAGRVPVTVVGPKGRKGHVRAGFPLPKGAVKDEGRIQIIDANGKSIPSMATALSKWEDDSIRWALLDFAGAAGQQVEVDFSGKASVQGPKHPIVQIEGADKAVTLDSGAIVVMTSTADLVREIRLGKDQAALGKMTLEMQVTLDGKATTLFAMPTEEIEVEEARALHGTLRMQGFFGTADGQKTPMKYDLRILAAAGSPRLTLLLTVTHWADRIRSQSRDEPWGNLEPKMTVVDLSLRFGLSEKPVALSFGTEKDAFTTSESAELVQPDDLKYAIRQPGKPDVPGTRAPGWTAARNGDTWCILGVRHFWQNCPKGLIAGPEAIGTRLYTGSTPFEWEGGLAKTHEVVLDFAAAGKNGDAPASVCLDPLRITMPPAWACGTEAIGAVLPRCPESLLTFPYWECWRNADMHGWVNAMPFGFRDFGDGYMGGPYKGKNAYVNLEYDVAYNYLLEFLRTGDTWYLESAEPMARHQTDVDVSNVSGVVWKHSPMHTTTEADLGHVFLRGVLLHYLLTGENRQLEMARRVGDFIAAKMERDSREVVGNERQIGWSLYLLTGVYEVTRDPKYLRACEKLCGGLLAGQKPTGKFEIRWDNRIAFFNGIAMNGMLTVQENNGDEKLAEGILRVANRTLGFYPEYACRTLNAFSWALQRTNDPRYLDALERSWRSSIEFLFDRNVETEATHMWRFPRFAARHGLFQMFDKPPALPEAASWKATRFKNADAEVFLRTMDGNAPVLVIREGLAEGKVELFDTAGKLMQSVSLENTSDYFEPAALVLPAGKSLYRLRLSSNKAYGWQVQSDHRVRMTVFDPAGVHLQQLFPQAVGFLREGAKEVKIRLEAMGEGFHMATLYNPAGQPVATVRHFIDFQDPGRYELELKAPVSGGARGWSLELCNLKVLSIEGLLPYWAAAEKELFNPERPSAP